MSRPTNTAETFDETEPSVGLKFQKLDLHLHTPASRCFGDKDITAQDIVNKAIEQGLSGIAVTDHNSGEWIDKVKQAAAGTELTVFPGVEISCTGGKSGVHIIALFEIDKGTEDIRAFLHQLKVLPTGYGKDETLVPLPPQDVIRMIHEFGGVASLAHSNSTKGVLADMIGEQRTLVIKCPFLFAAEASDFKSADKQERKCRVVDFLDGTDPNYRRKLAVYQASDNPSGDGSGQHSLDGIGARCAYFKLQQVNLEGLRQCFFDPDVRIRQDFEYSDAKYPHIKSIQVKGGFLDGAFAEFHPGLNSILGGKGTGKSLLVELMRFACDQEPTNPDILSDHESKLSNRFGDHSEIEIIVVDETGKEFTLQRTYLPFDDNPYEEEEQYYFAQSFPVLFLSQNEIVRIAESEKEQIAFIDRFFDFRRYKAKLVELEGTLKESDRRVAKCIHARKAEKALKTQAAQLTSELASLSQSLKNPSFEKFSFAEKKTSALSLHAEYVEQVLNDIDVVEEDLLRAAFPLIDDEMASDPALKRCQSACKGVQNAARIKLEELRADIRKELLLIDKEKEQWKPSFEKAQAAYKRTIKKSGGNYQELEAKRAGVARTLENIRKQLASKGEIGKQLKGLIEERNKALDEIEKVYRDYSQSRRDRCAKIQEESAGRLQVSIHSSSNADLFREGLLKFRRGSGVRETDVQALTEKIPPKTFIYSLFRFQLRGETEPIGKIAERAGIDAGKLRSFAEFLLSNIDYEELLELQYKAIPQDRPEILYQLGEGQYEPVSRISTGQKAVALLIMTLADGTMPIVIDQPEDSLDLSSVWEDICSKVRLGKEKRQFLFTTHNSSLAVASDTDCFTILAGDANKGSVLYSGSMDHKPLDEQVLTYLEGGERTYALKYRKYNADQKL